MDQLFMWLVAVSKLGGENGSYVGFMIEQDYLPRR